MLVRFDPFREFDRLTQQLWGTAGQTSTLPMPMDAYRKGDEFIVRFDLPGIDPQSIDVTVEKMEPPKAAEKAQKRLEDLLRSKGYLKG